MLHLLAIVAAVVVALPAAGQPVPVVVPSSAPAAAIPPNASNLPEPTLVKAVEWREGGDAVGLGDAIVVTLNGYEAWRRSNEVKSLVLYLDGHPVATSSRPGAATDQLVFDLAWRQDSAAQWAAILGKPESAARRAVVQVGVDKLIPFKGALPLQIQAFHGIRIAIFVVLLLGLSIIFFHLAKKSDLLRDGPIVPAVGRRCFSLGRTQMAAWFLVVVAAFLFIWVVTGTYQPLTPQVLTLIGISGGTALSAAFIDANKQAAIDNQAKSLRSERLKVETEIAALKATIGQTQARIDSAAQSVDTTGLRGALTQAVSELAAKEARRDQAQAELEAVGSALMPRSSAGFWKDIVSDENGVGFHRFQIVAWTLVLMLIFGFAVYETLGMPTFPAELLALMGISAGTYLGFKIPEPS